MKIGVSIFALISAFIGFLTAIIEVSIHNVESIETIISEVLTGFFSNLFSSVFYGFAFITIGFVIYEQAMKNSKTPPKPFFIEDLKEVIDSTKSETIPIIGPVVSIIVTVCISIFLVLMSIGIIPSLVWIEGEHLRVHSFFSKEFLNHLLIIVPILALGSISLDALKLKYRKWNKVLSYGVIGLSLLFVGLFIFLFLNTNMLSAEFISYLETLSVDEPSIIKGLTNGNIISTVGIVIVGTIGSIGVGQSIYKLIKLNQ